MEEALSTEPDLHLTDEKEAAIALIMLSRGNIVSEDIPSSGHTHQPSSYKCLVVCGKTFSSNEAFGEHMNGHWTPVVRTQSASAWAQSKKTYDCPICSKSFPSNKDLEDHMSGHWRPVGTNQSTGTSRSAWRKKKYECRICHKFFFTGQQLGGHKGHHCRRKVSLKSLS